jgi:hypothetical protein
MDLITAKVEAASKSKKFSSIVFVNVRPEGHKDEGDCFLDKTANSTTQAIFKSGAEVKINSTDWQNLIGSGSFVEIGKQMRIASDSKPFIVTAEQAKSMTVEEIKENVDRINKVKKVKEKPVKSLPKKKVKKMPVTKTAKSKKVAAAPKKSDSKKKVAAKVLTPKDSEPRITKGNNMALTEAQWKKVDAKIKAMGERSFSSYSRNLVLKDIK